MSESTGTLHIWGCGGAGINNAAFFNGATQEPNCAQIKTSYIDASRSNLRDDFKDEDVFILEHKDGSGKVRTENHEEISNVIKQIILQMEPGDLNAVVFSASGGSGSVIGPLLLAELLRQDYTAVCIVVGSDESTITAKNTHNTLKSLESIAQRTEKPVVMYYEQNDRERKRSDVNNQIYLVLSMLAILAHRRNREIDTKDLANWAQFHRTTSVNPQLAQFEVFTSPEQATDVVRDPISAVSIYGDEDADPINMVPEYHAAGYLREPFDQFNEIHFIISIDAIPNIVSNIKETLDQYQSQRDSRVKQQSILNQDDQPTDDGLVL